MRRRRAAVARMRGFTLIELIATITLFAVLTGLAVPAFTDWIRNSQVRTVAEALQTGLRTAQAEAVRRNRTVVMVFTNATPGLSPTAAAGGANWSLQTVPSLGDSAGEFITGGAFGDVASGVTIASLPSQAQLCFNASGRLFTSAAAGCTAAATRFTVSRPSATRRYRVDLQLGGQMRMCDIDRPALSATAPDGCPP